MTAPSNSHPIILLLFPKVIQNVNSLFHKIIFHYENSKDQIR